MTVDTPRTVIELLAEDPLLRAYQYRHARTGAVLYALFPPGQTDDMAWAPEVQDPVLLSDGGSPTAAGWSWLVEVLATHNGSRGTETSEK